MTYHLSPLKNIFENSRSMSCYLIPHHLSPLKIILKFQENHLTSCHLSPLKNNSENSSSMSHHLSLMKNNSKNSRKSPHAASHFSIEKNLKIRGACYITSCHATFLH
jgi:hypothetical protein